MKIAFAHNVYDRFKTLKNTIEIEKKYFPDAPISIAYNNTYVDIFKDITNFSAISFNQKTHKIGCTNGCILSIKQLLDVDFDVLIFSHDDIFIYEPKIDVVHKHIESIVNGEFDVICRKPIRLVNSIDTIQGYCMMDVFYASKNAITKLFMDVKVFEKESDIPSANYVNSIAPEVWFYNLINNKGLKINEIGYDSFNPEYNDQFSKQMGYYHKNNLIRGWKDK